MMTNKTWRRYLRAKMSGAIKNDPGRNTVMTRGKPVLRIVENEPVDTENEERTDDDSGE